MKKIYLNIESIRNVFNQLKENFNGVLTSNNNEYYLKLESRFIKGNIEASSFDEGMACIQCNINCSEHIMLNMRSFKSTSILFIYCMEGILKHSFNEYGDEKCLMTNHTSILRNTEKNSSNLYFEKNTPLRFTIIAVTNNSPVYIQNNETLINKLQQTFFQNRENYVHLKYQNFKIIEKLEQLNAISKKKIVRNLLKRGLLQLILAHEIEQHTINFSPVSQGLNPLTISQINEINKISSFIKNFPGEQFTINFLTQKTGLSPNKLQKGFKLLHNRTVNGFITYMRMEKAERLIRTSDLNISEVVYSIGFTSRSYFSKIFKKKYNCSPKKYKQYKNLVAETA